MTRNRYGILLKFKPGISRLEAEVALASLADLVEPSVVYPHITEETRHLPRHLRKRDYSRPEKTETPHVKEYNPEHGEPVWYIP